MVDICFQNKYILCNRHSVNPLTAKPIPIDYARRVVLYNLRNIWETSEPKIRAENAENQIFCSYAISLKCMWITCSAKGASKYQAD